MLLDEDVMDPSVIMYGLDASATQFGPEADTVHIRRIKAATDVRLLSSRIETSVVAAVEEIVHTSSSYSILLLFSTLTSSMLTFVFLSTVVTAISISITLLPRSPNSVDAKRVTYRFKSARRRNCDLRNDFALRCDVVAVE